MLIAKFCSLWLSLKIPYNILWISTINSYFKFNKKRLLYLYFLNKFDSYNMRCGN